MAVGNVVPPGEIFVAETVAVSGKDTWAMIAGHGGCAYGKYKRCGEEFACQ